MFKKIVPIVVVLIIAAVFAYAQINDGVDSMPPDPRGPGMGPGMGPMPGMGMGMGGPMMMPGMPAVMNISGNNIYILRGDQLVKLDSDLKIIKQVMLPRPTMPRQAQPGNGMPRN